MTGAVPEGGAMPPMVPDASTIPEMLAASIEGPYQFIHHALVPYVQIMPSGDHAVTVRAGRHLALAPEGQHTRRVDPGHVLVLAVCFEGPDICLRELHTAEGPRAPAPARRPAVTPQAPPPTPRPSPRPRRLVVAQAPARPAVEPTDLPWLEALRTQAGCDPSQGDYLVLPTAMVPPETVLPVWVAVTPHVQTPRVVKRRLETDEAIDWEMP